MLAIEPHGHGPFWTGSLPAFRSRFGKHCFLVVVRSGQGNSPERRNESGDIWRLLHRTASHKFHPIDRRKRAFCTSLSQTEYLRSQRKKCGPKGRENQQDQRGVVTHLKRQWRWQGQRTALALASRRPLASDRNRRSSGSIWEHSYSNIRQHPRSSSTMVWVDKYRCRATGIL